jgi:CSLREA domain-containing protein
LFRPRLESLEDRSVPATLNVTTTLDVVDPADGKRSLREAISAANNRPGADLIVVPAGVYQIAREGADENDNATGDFDISGPATIRGAGAGATLVEGQLLDRVFDAIGNGPLSFTLVLEDLQVRNGRATGNGGGIRVGNANLVVRDCIVAGKAGGKCHPRPHHTGT